METVLLYLGKVIVSSGVMFLYYQLSLKDKTFHHYNRFYLLFAMVISLLLPLISVSDFTIEVNNDMYMLLDKIQNFNTEKNIDNGHIYFRIIFSALGLVSFYFLGKLIFGILKIQRLKKQFQKESFDGINFYRTDLTEAPFSYFRNLFWKNTITLNSDVGEQILKHEMVHIEQKHSFDKIFIEIITSVFWFNPFFHIIKKEISLIHEYLADKKAVKQSDTKAFAQMLLASHFSGTQLPATSPFLSSNLKKRLKMLQKPKTKFGYARRIFALPVLFSVAFAYMVNAKNKEIKETNIAIEEAVSQIKKDTIRPQKTEITEPKLFNESGSKKEITELGKKIEEKSRVLKTLKPESKEFQQKLDELGELSGELGKITSSDDFRKALNFSQAETKKINEFFNSDEWKNKTKTIESLGIEMPDLSNLSMNFPDAPPSPPTPPNAYGVRVLRFNDNSDQNWKPETEKEARKARKKAEKARAEAIKLGEKARKMGEEARIQGEAARIAGEKARIEAMKAGDMGRFQGEVARVAGEKARIVGERARLEGEKARIAGEKIRVEVEKRFSGGAKGNFYFLKSTNSNTSGSVNRTLELEGDYIKVDGKGSIAMNGVKKIKVNNWEDTAIFLDGKEISKAEFDALKPEKIASVTINKESGANASRGEIRIQTKK
ncbi:beta-lactamase regulating signal transducer with metallopeptidase domain [Chryseobacterium sp. 52]|uniref:M56 family metallopeptidase n=1 Tax=Chryseobacterium sp. 52 TaxID=2035213 RepID=UPI000C18B6D0|nr:M56 family metallopeptidase [Chryseobacterium sp. 52]PIF46177.1 beta-lactamase regulating signal transducer with metallopeptidase domain [Chryseobacterium sp. 52]